MVARIWKPGSGSQDLEARIWKPGSGSQDGARMLAEARMSIQQEAKSS